MYKCHSAKKKQCINVYKVRFTLWQKKTMYKCHVVLVKVRLDST